MEIDVGIKIATLWARRAMQCLSFVSVISATTIMIPAGAQEIVRNIRGSRQVVATLPSDAVGLLKAEAARLALYTANQEPLVVLAIAARKGKNAEVVAAIKRHGGRVDYRLDTIDYLAAVLPTKTVASFLAEPALHAVAVDNLSDDYASQIIWLSMNDRSEQGEALSGAVGASVAKARTVAEVGRARLPSLPARPLEFRHSILRDMDGEAFRKRDPRFDGRGVVIAHLEAFPDFLSPELQLAKDVSGKDIPKFADVINIPAVALSLDPAAPRRGDRWTTRLSKPVTSRGLVLEHGSKIFRLPKPGTYRVAQFELPSKGWGRRIYPHVRKVNVLSKSMKEGAPIFLDVLWSEREKRLWIDSNGDGDFGDEEGVGIYRISHQFGVLGKDDPATEFRETTPYAVQKDGDYIGINLLYNAHATAVAGAAAASRGKGLVDGVAPGAQLIAINAHGNASITAYARALAVAYTDTRIDIVLVEGHGQINSPYGSKDGRSILAILMSRLVEHYRKPTLATAGNATWMSFVSDFTVPQNVMSIGASQSSASLFSYYGFRARHAQDLHWSGAEGPSGDGALKPDILAPANPLSVYPRDRWELTSDYIYPGVFRLPVGYMICGGTSCATPVAAGAAALLVGAAKLHGLPHDADAIHEALRNSANFMEHRPAYKQGRGIIQIDAAWRYLNARAKAQERYDIDIAAPVRTVLSDTLPRPHIGRGLFEREGWRAGMRQERVIMLTRRSGPKKAVRFDIRWQGNGGAVTSSDSISLPLGKPVPLKLNLDTGF